MKLEDDYICISLFSKTMQEETNAPTVTREPEDTADQPLSPTLTLPTSLVQKIVDYLQAKPYGEVYMLMNDLLRTVNEQSLRS